MLILLNAAFAGSEIALISLRPSQLDRLRDRGKRGATLAKLPKDPNEFLATVQIGITLAGFLASATAAVSLAEPLVPLLSPLGGAAGPVAILLVTLVLTFLTLVAGELAPKRIAMARAEGWALLAARPLQLLATLSRPAVWLLGRSTDILVRLAGVDPRALRDEVGDDELREMVLTRSPSPRQAQILEGTFELAERRVRDILVPRPQVTLVDPAADAGAAIAVLQQSGTPAPRSAMTWTGCRGSCISRTSSDTTARPPRWHARRCSCRSPSRCWTPCGRFRDSGAISPWSWTSTAGGRRPVAGGRPRGARRRDLRRVRP